MLKVYLKLRAIKDLPHEGWKKDEYCELISDVFDKQNGIAFSSLNKDWEIVKMEIREYKPIHALADDDTGAEQCNLPFVVGSACSCSNPEPIEYPCYPSKQYCKNCEKEITN